MSCTAYTTFRKNSIWRQAKNPEKAAEIFGPRREGCQALPCGVWPSWLKSGHARPKIGHGLRLRPPSPFRALRRSLGKARIALPEKNAALAKKKLAKGWGCLYTPFCAERSAPWQGSSVGQSMRFIPAVSRVQISPLLPESNNPGCPQGVRGFRVAGFRVFGFRVLWRCAPVFHVSAFVRQTFAMPAQPCRLCPGARHAFTKVIGVHCARTSARPGRQPGCRPPPSLA